MTEPGGRDNISIASAPLGAAQPRNPSGSRPRSARAAEWARGSRPLPSRVWPQLSLPNPLRLPPRPGLRRPPPSANPAVNERPAPPGAGCRRRGLPGGARPAKMYGKEGSLPPGWQTCRTRTIVPLRGPGEARGCGLGARLGSLCRSVCARLRWEDKDAQDRRPRGPCGPSGRLFEGSGRVGGGPSGCGGARGIRSSWVLGKASLPWCQGGGGVGGGGRVTAFAELTKAGCTGEFYAGSRSGIAGRRSLAALCRLRGCGRRRPRCRGLARERETGLAAPGWTWPLPSPAARGTQAPKLPDMPSAMLKGRDAAEGARQLWVATSVCHPISLAPFHGHPLN